MERLLVWHSSKFAEPHFTVDVPDVVMGAFVLHILAQYDLYQGEERVASNAQGLCVAPFGEVLDLIGAAWQGQPHNATTYILRATAAVKLQARRIKRVIDPATFKDRVGLHTPALVTRAGGQLAKTHNVPLWRGIGQKMIDELNWGLRGDSKHRIPPLI